MCKAVQSPSSAMSAIFCTLLRFSAVVVNSVVNAHRDSHVSLHENMQTKFWNNQRWAPAMRTKVSVCLHIYY